MVSVLRWFYDCACVQAWYGSGLLMFRKQSYTLGVASNIEFLTKKVGGYYNRFHGTGFEREKITLSEQIRGKVALIDFSH